MILFVVFAGPILVSFVTSFTDMGIADIRHPFDVSFVGLDNYVDVFRDDVPQGGATRRYTSCSPFR